MNGRAGRSLVVLLVGHAFGPNLGSEPGLTWNWAWHLSARHQVWVIAHPKYRAEAEAYLAEHPNPNLRVEWVTLPKWLDPWKPERGERGIRQHYMVWQHLALRAARRLQAARRFDLVHHVSWNTLSAPPLLWRLPTPFVWGPVGGGQTAPPAFREAFGSAWRWQRLRSLRVRLMPFSPALRRAVRGSALLLATNGETARLLERAGARAVHLFYDNGLPSAALANPPSPRSDAEVTLLWAGRLEPRKALGLVIDAMTRVRDLPVRLVVAGDGPMRGEWERQAAAAGLNGEARFLGLVPREEMTTLFERADAFVFSSLQDSSGSVVFEAMAHGLPVVALDHQGIGAFVSTEAAIKVPVTTPDETVAGLAHAFRRLALDADGRRRMGEAAWSCAKTQSWPRRADQLSAWYEACLDDPRLARSS